MVLLFMILIFILPTQILAASKEIIVENPFYLRARLHDSHTASVQFEIAREKDQRSCQMYKFTIRRNNEKVFYMPEQNLTFWRNSLELQHLTAGTYRVCAIICSEQLNEIQDVYEKYDVKNQSNPIKACVYFTTFSPQFLVLTLYILVFIFLVFSHTVYTLKKRQFQARMKVALMEVEHSLQKWRNSDTSESIDHPHSYAILQSLINLPAVPIAQSSLQRLPSDHSEQQHPLLFHIENLHDNQSSV